MTGAGHEAQWSIVALAGLAHATVVDTTQRESSSIRLLSKLGGLHTGIVE